MASDRFVILEINSSDAGLSALLRCTRSGEASGFHFQTDMFLGRTPILCEGGTGALFDLSRPAVGLALGRAFVGAFPWAPPVERRLRPRPN